MELAINIDYIKRFSDHISSYLRWITPKQQLANSNYAPTSAKIKRVPIPCLGVVGVADWFDGEFGQGTQSYVGIARVR